MFRTVRKVFRAGEKSLASSKQTGYGGACLQSHCQEVETASLGLAAQPMGPTVSQNMVDGT